MKGMIILVPLLATLWVVAGIRASAQTPRRIQFAKGKSSAVVKGTTGPHGTYFVLRAKAGQMLVLDVTPASGVGVKVETVGRFGHMVLLREEAGGKYEVGLEEAGDYTIFVGPLGRNPLTFTLTVQVRKLADI
jgi:hypothetical protein